MLSAHPSWCHPERSRRIVSHLEVASWSRITVNKRFVAESLIHSRSRTITATQHRKRLGDEFRSKPLKLLRGVFDLQGRRKPPAPRSRRCRLGLWRLNSISWLEAGFWERRFRPELAERVKQWDRLSAVGPRWDTVERALEAVQAAMRTWRRRHAVSKPAARIGNGGHEESKPAK